MSPRRTALWLLMAGLFAACGTPRKAFDRLVRKYPELLDSTVVQVQLPGADTADAAGFEDPQLDSLQAACQQLADALTAERDLYLAALAAERARPAGEPTPPVLASVPRSRAAVQQVRRTACSAEPIHWADSLCTLYVQLDGDSIRWRHERRAQQLAVPCPPAVTITAHTPWWNYLYAFLVGVGAGAGLLGLLLAKGPRTHAPR